MCPLCVVVLTVFVGICTFVSYVKYTRRNSKYLVNIKGPPPNIVFGNMLDFFGSSADFLDTIGKYFKVYGKNVLIYDGPFSKLILITDYKFLEFILSSTKYIDKADNYEFFHNWLGTGLLTSTGSKWKARRRLLTPSFHFSILENFVEVFESVGNIFIEKLDKEVDKGSVNIQPLVALCTLDVICEAAMGISINAQQDENSEYVRSVKTMCSIITDRNFSALDPKLFSLTWNYFREKRALKVLHEHTVRVIDQKLIEAKDLKENNFENGLHKRKKPAFLDLLIQSSANDPSFTRFDIREEVDTFMFEGHDTTSSAISFGLYTLANNPDAQRKAVEEQKTIFGNNKSLKTTMTELQQMKYLELVIKETLRLYPPVPIFGRKIAEDFEYEGTIFPKGSNMVVLPFFTQRYPDYFPDPEKFIPERFLTQDIKNPYVYIPFSAGPRNCIGQKFAMLEMKSTLSKVLRHFELLPSETAHELRLAPEIILLSKTGVNIRLKRRIM